MFSTETENPALAAVKKTFLLLTTMLPLCGTAALPIVNNGPSSGGKCIKQGSYTAFEISPPDSTFVIVPSFRLADPNNYRIRTVVIDPGHGGHDPGCSGHNTKEKNVVLAIGKYLAQDLKQRFPDLQVVMTRSTDVFVPLHKRASIATEHKADLFISIHCNAFPNDGARGTETYVLGLHATKENLEVAKRENDAILLEDNYRENYGYDPNSPEAHIMFSMFQNAFLEQSIAFAEKVQDNAKQQTGLKNRGVKQAGFLVLRYATMPSVLVETGYLTNGSDEAYLHTENGQQAMATALLNAFIEYKADMEKSAAEPATQVAYSSPKKIEPTQHIASTKKANTEIQPTVAEKALPTTNTAVLPKENPAPAKPILKEIPTTSKKSNLVIGPPSTPEPPKENTNVSPKKNSKISADTPLEDPMENALPVTVPEKKETNTTPEPSVMVQYCVQLAASPTLLNIDAGKWAKLSHSVEVIEEAGLFKYQIRNFDSLENANSTRSKLRGIGFNDAFVVAYKDGKRVDPRTLK